MNDRIAYISNRGLPIALTILALWAAAVATGLTLTLSVEFIPLYVVLFAVITQLYTGLFITAHDAMHGTVYPRNKTINNLVGSIALICFALFSFRKTIRKHWQHHDHPASSRDPDYHDGKHRSFFAWYFSFMREYMSIYQLIGLALIFQILEHVVGISALNIALFWALPPIVSSVQLFYFGTYLPHRGEVASFEDDHHARSNEYSVLWSFLSCYHFGYHWEHHQYPGTPWWLLPQKRSETRSSPATQAGT